MEIHKKIKSIRSVKGISQAEMAESLNIAVNNYSKIERGVTELTLSRINEIADILGVTVAEILGIEEVGNSVKEKEEEITRLKERIKQNREYFKPFQIILTNLFWSTAFKNARELSIFDEDEVFNYGVHSLFENKLTPNQLEKLYVEKLSKIPFMYHTILQTDIAPKLKEIALENIDLGFNEDTSI